MAPASHDHQASNSSATRTRKFMTRRMYPWRRDKTLWSWPTVQFLRAGCASLSGSHGATERGTAVQAGDRQQVHKKKYLLARAHKRHTTAPLLAGLQACRHNLDLRQPSPQILSALLSLPHACNTILCEALRNELHAVVGGDAGVVVGVCSR